MRRRIAQGNHRSRPQRLNNGGRQHWIFVGSFFVATVACAALFMIVPLDWDQAPVLSKLPNATIDDAYDPVRQFNIKLFLWQIFSTFGALIGHNFTLVCKPAIQNRHNLD